MPVTALQGFGGTAPKLDPRVLADRVAQIAIDCRFDRGVLEGIHEPLDTAVAIASGTKVVYPYNNAWLSYSDDVDIVSAAHNNDAFDRLYLTDPAYPKVRDQTGSTFRLGLPAPVDAVAVTPVVPVNQESADSLLLTETIHYVCTFVDAYGSEGPPGVVSVSADRERDTDVNLVLPSAPVGNYNWQAGALTRIYRSNAGTATSSFQFVAEVAHGTTAFVDTVKNVNLQELIPSVSWIGPPDDNTTLYPDGPMQGLTAMTNGILAGFVGKTVAFCEPYVPYAWPLRYRLSTNEDIVGIVSLQQGLLVVTTGRPYFVRGSHPESFALQTVESDQSCVSRRSIVDMGGYAIYASPDGLVSVSGNAANVVTAELLDKKSWANYAPETIRAERHEGRYVAFYDTGSKQAGFIFDPRGGLNALSDIRDYSLVLYSSTKDDQLYIEKDDTLQAWEADLTRRRTAIWRSKRFVDQRARGYGMCRAIADSFPFTVTLYDGNKPLRMFPVASPTQGFKPVRIKDLTIEIQTKGAVSSIGIGNNLGEF